MCRKSNRLFIGSTPTNGPAAVWQFDSGAEMDASVSVGDIVELIGVDTRARIALLECAQLAPVRYFLRGPINLYNSTEGVEFDGVIGFEALGTGSVPDWANSTPGDDTVGGPRLAGTGTFKINGLGRVRGKGSPWIHASGYLVTRSAGVTNDCLMVGFVSDGDDATFTGAGIGKSATGWANCAVGDGAVNGFVPGFNTNYVAQPAEADYWWMDCNPNPYNGNPPTGYQVSGGAHSDTQSAVRASVADATSGHVGDTDLQPALHKTGTFVYHLNYIFFPNG